MRTLGRFVRAPGAAACLLAAAAFACAAFAARAPRPAAADPLSAWETGAALLDAGRNAEAATHFERALASAPGSIPLAEGLFDAFSRLCLRDSALAVLSRSAAAVPEGARSRFETYLEGVGFRRHRRLDEAARRFRAAAVRARADGDTLSAAFAVRALVLVDVAEQNARGALEPAAAYRAFAAGMPSERLRADAAALEADCLNAADSAAAADTLYRRTLAAARAAGYRRIEAVCLAGVGRLDDKRQRNASALELYGAALALERAMADPEGTAILLNGVGQIEARTGALDAAAAHLAEAERTAASCGFDWILGFVYYGYGAVAEARGDREEALKLFQRSLALHRASRNAWGELGAHLRLGYLRSTNGEYARAIGHYERARAYYDSIGSLYGKGWALSGLAVAYHRLGDFRRAEEEYRGAIEARRAIGDRAGTAWALNSLAMVADIQGKYRDALALAGEAMAIYEDTGDRGGTGEAYYTMGSVWFFTGDYERARALYDSAFAIASELRDDALLRRVASGLGSVYGAAGRSDLARAFYEGALALERRAGYRIGVAWALNNLASAELELGSTPRARSYLDEALRTLPPRGENYLRARTLYLLARTETGGRSIARLEEALALADSSSLGELVWKCLSDLGVRYLAAGDTARAYSFQHRAVVAVESLRRLAGSDELRRHFLTPAILPYERIVDLILERSGRPADVKEALTYTERSRAQILAAHLRDAAERTAAQGSETLLRRERDILSRLAFLQSRLQRGSLSPEERADILGKIDALERRFTSLSLEFENGRRPDAGILYPRVEQPDELLQALRPGERLLSYFLGERRSYLFSVAGGAIEVRELPARGRIEERAERFVSLVQQNAEAGTGGAGAPGTAVPEAIVDVAARELFDLLLGPIAKTIAPGERLVIVPDGALARLPFALLREGDACLVERHDISFAPSLRALRYLRARDDRRARSPGAPLYGIVSVGASGGLPGPAGNAARVYPFTNVPIAPLAAAEEEARSVGALIPRALVLTGRGAVESAFKASPLYDTGVLHIAAHAYVDEDDVRRSFMVLNPERSFADTAAAPDEDGLLQWHEIAALKLNAALVTLPACRSAGGVLARGEGITGFAQAFLHAGAGCVVAAQVDVPDRAAGDFMTQFYANIRNGMDAAGALAAAQRTFLAGGAAGASGDVPAAVWGSFVLIGDGAVVPKLGRGPSPAVYIALGLLIVGGAAVAWNAFRRRL